MIEVYCHTSPSGKRYVGVATYGACMRWKQHVWDALRGSDLPFHRAIRKYGADSFSHETLAVCDTFQGAMSAERYWIELLRSKGPGGYNATDGGEGPNGLQHSETFKERMSARVKALWGCPEYRERMRAARAEVWRRPDFRSKVIAGHIGGKRSAETRARMSAAQKARFAAERAAGITHRGRPGVTPTPETCAKISTAKKGRPWSAARRAAEERKRAT